MTETGAPLPTCEACGEAVEKVRTMHPVCIERLLARVRRGQRGASLIEYVMLMAFVAVIAIIGVRAVGPAAVNLFDVEGLGLATPATVPTEVLGVTLERPFAAPIACQPAPGLNHPVCPQ